LYHAIPEGMRVVVPSCRTSRVLYAFTFRYLVVQRVTFSGGRAYSPWNSQPVAASPNAPPIAHTPARPAVAFTPTQTHLVVIKYAASKGSCPAAGRGSGRYVDRRTVRRRCPSLLKSACSWSSSSATTTSTATPRSLKPQSATSSLTPCSSRLAGTSTTPRALRCNHRTPHEVAALQRRIEMTDRQIDALVYELYALTPEEIEVVEGATDKNE
jgi:hypothetical protein